MSFLGSLLSSAGAFLLLGLIFWPMEKVFPARHGQKIFRAAWWTDFFFFLGQYLFWGGLVIAVLSTIETWISSMVSADFRNAVAGQPLWLQLIEVLLLSDLCIYWGHRIQHKIPFLWRFHAIHHSAEHLDWLAAHREHPIDTIYTMTIINLPLMIVGFPIETMGGILAFRGLWAIYIHSNVRLPIGWVRVIIGAPELHHWHHDRDRNAGNYANISPLMDVIFGTYRCPNHEPESFGIREPIPQNYTGQLLHPFKIRKKTRHRNTHL